MDCAAQDFWELALEEKELKAENYLQNLTALFESMDLNHDNALSIREMRSAFNNDKFRCYMDLLDLKISDVEPLFQILDKRDQMDGMVTLDEFCEGMNRIKGAARSYDVMRILHEQSNGHSKLEARCQDILNKLEESK